MTIYIHGIGEHPPKEEWKREWDLALFGKPMGDSTSMAYWSDILHGRPSRLRTRSLDHNRGNQDLKVDLASILKEANIPNTKRSKAGTLLEGLAHAIAMDAAHMPARGRQGPATKILPLPGGLRRAVAAAFLKQFLKDVAAYFFQARARAGIQERLRAEIRRTRDNFVLVSHSLGTVVAFDILSERKSRPDCSLFVTMGSPLGIQEVQDVLEDFGGELIIPPNVLAWHNFADRLDPVAIDARLARDFKPRDGRRIIDHSIINERTADLRRFNPHSSLGYLSHRDVRTVVHHDSGFDSAGRFVVARDVAEEFVDPERRLPVLIEVLEPGYNAVDESDDNRHSREASQSKEAENLQTLSGRIMWLKDCVERIAVERTLGQEAPDAKRQDCLKKIGAVALRKYLAANLTPDEVVAVSAQHDDLNVYAVWKNSRKRKLLHRSHVSLKADAGRESYGAHGASITWAVLDTGVRWDHPHFKDTISEVWDCTTSDDQPAPMYRNARSVAPYRDDTADRDGHGTHVCGIVAGSHSEGSRVYSGVAPQCRLIVYKVLDDDGFGNDAWIIKAIDHIFHKNQSVVSGLCVHGVNLSLGGPFDATVYGCGFSPICKELRDLWRQGTLVCVAAGNEGQIQVQTEDGGFDLNTQLSIGDPANLHDCVAVGSVNADKPYLYGVSWFSSRGPTADGRPKPDVVAPGERILSCNSAFKKKRTNPREKPQFENLYRAESGTSMACPHVSGLLAAFLSVRPEYKGRPDEVKQILLDNCNDLGRDPYHQGAGIPNLMKMLTNT
jgi:subtilisin family serine protease